MTDHEKLMLAASLCISRGDACHLLSDLITEINKTGGERQRSEGKKKLLRIRDYLRDTLMVDWEDYRETSIVVGVRK